MLDYTTELRLDDAKDYVRTYRTKNPVTTFLTDRQAARALLMGFASAYLAQRDRDEVARIVGEALWEAQWRLGSAAVDSDRD